jgi:predicted transcriptional regulator
MVAPNYAAARSEMAKRIGLGQKGPAARKPKGGSKKKAAA